MGMGQSETMTKWPSGNGLNAIGPSVIGLNGFRPRVVFVTSDMPHFESKSTAFE